MITLDVGHFLNEKMKKIDIEHCQAGRGHCQPWTAQDGPQFAGHPTSY